jgi:hypothetical protein
MSIPIGEFQDLQDYLFADSSSSPKIKKIEHTGLKVTQVKQTNL